MPHIISLEPLTPGILESSIWINSFGDDPLSFDLYIFLVYSSKDIISSVLIQQIRTNHGNIIKWLGVIITAGASGIGLSIAEKFMAMELGELGIRMNAICPGIVEGSRIDCVIATDTEKWEQRMENNLVGYLKNDDDQ